jgi:hypothetical protein
MSTIAQIQPPIQSDAGMVCVFVAAIAIGAPNGAVILRAGCSSYNKLLGGKGSPRAVPEPDFLKAIGITLANYLLGGLAGLALRTFEFIGDFNAFAAGLLLGILIMSALITLCLPTTFMRALLVSIVVQVVATAVGLVVGAMIALAFWLKLIIEVRKS